MLLIDAVAVVLFFPLRGMIGDEVAGLLVLLVVIASPAIAARIP